MEVFEAIQIQALKSVLDPDDDYLMRKVFRWYSEKYHTPLHVVDDLPMDDVLQTYFEYVYENTSKRQLNQIKKHLLETPEEREKREKAKEKSASTKKKKEKKTSDDAFLEMLKKKTVGEKDVVAALQKKREQDAQKMMEALDDQDPLAPPEFSMNFNRNLE